MTMHDISVRKVEEKAERQFERRYVQRTVGNTIYLECAAGEQKPCGANILKITTDEMGELHYHSYMAQQGNDVGGYDDDTMSFEVRGRCKRCRARHDIRFLSGREGMCLQDKIEDVSAS